MKKTIKIVLVLSCVASLFFVGCHKKETVEVDNETQSSVDNAIADQEYMSIVPATNGHAINTKGTGANNGRLMMPISPCDSLTWINRTTSDTTFVNQLANPIFTMNISASSCSNTIPDGRNRTGQLQIRLTGRIKKPGSKMIIKMIGYKVTVPMGTSTTIVTYSCDSMVVTTLDSSALFTKFNVKLINGQCLWGAGKVIKYSSDRTITNYSKGNPINTDPVTEIFGTANGVNREGRAFSVNIPAASPLVKHKSCKWIEKGIFELTPDGFKTRTIDFGYSVSPNPYGGCDSDASFTVNGSIVAFKLN